MIRVPVPLAGGKAGEQQILNGWMITPPNFDSNRRYPVLMNQYSGPALRKWLTNGGVPTIIFTRCWLSRATLWCV